MKKNFMLLSMVMLMSLGMSAQTIIAAWTFDDLLAAPKTPTVIAANADFGELPSSATIYLDGTNGSSKFDPTLNKPQINSFSGSTVGDPRDEKLSGKALALANKMSNGNHVVIKFSTKNFAFIKMSFATRGTKTGFASHGWSYSVDGKEFTKFETAETANTTSSFTLKELDFSAIEALNNQENVYLRLTIDEATDSSGNNRLDNIVLRGSFTGSDNVAPVLKSFEVASTTTMNLKFSEPLDSSCVKPANFVILDSVVSVKEAVCTGADVTLTFNALEEAKEYKMVLANLTDTAGNIMKNDTINFLFGVTPEFMVKTIAELRSKIDASITSGNIADSIVYKLTGEAIVTAKAQYNNQKFIQDSTAAIYIYDPKGIITTALEIGDKITDIYGTLTNYYGFIQFVPVKNIRFVSSFNEVEPLVITLDSLRNNAFMGKHQSELVKIEGVTFADGGENFESRTKYDITQDSITDNAIYVNFDESDIVKTAIPKEKVNVTGVVYQHYYTDESDEKINRYYIIPRSKSDITVSTGIINFNKQIFNVYPNPATDYVTVETDAQNVVANVFDIYGKHVYTTQIATGYDRINVSSLTSGMYILRLTSGNQLVGTAKIIKK